MKSARLALVVCSLTAFALTACSSPAPSREAPDVESAGPVTTPSPTPTEESEPSQDRNERGNLVKGVGEPFGLLTETNEEAASFTVTGIALDPACTGQFASASENGHLLKIDIEGETTPAYVPESGFLAYGSWKVIAENGTTFNGNLLTGAAMMCLDDTEQLNVNIGPAERLAGSLVFDVPSATGVLVNDYWGRGGWEWAYPQ